MSDDQDSMRIGDFATLVGLSIPQLRRYDRMQLLEPEGRSEAGYRRYSAGQTGAGRVISLLRSIDGPIADVRRVLAGTSSASRHPHDRWLTLSQQPAYSSCDRGLSGVTLGPHCGVP